MSGGRGRRSGRETWGEGIENSVGGDGVLTQAPIPMRGVSVPLV